MDSPTKMVSLILNEREALFVCDAVNLASATATGEEVFIQGGVNNIFQARSLGLYGKAENEAVLKKIAKVAEFFHPELKE